LQLVSARGTRRPTEIEKHAFSAVGVRRLA
jgi:hypothetical protein